MVKYLSKINSWLRCFASFLLAAGVAALLCVFLEGPRLGSFYDFLLSRRPALPISQEILIIDSAIPGQGLGNDILEPGTVSALLYTLAELRANTLIIQVPILGLSAGGTAGEEDILHHFDEEFSILSRNIRNLFEGIRTGSVTPQDSPRYVGELVELSERGKERLVSALVRRDEEGIFNMEKAAAFFGNARRPGDLRVQLIRAGSGGQPGVLEEPGTYSRVQGDRDGVLRRIAPLLTVPDLSGGAAMERTLEHIIFRTLKTRYESSEIEYIYTSGISAGWIMYPMVLALRNGPDGTDTILPLDRNAALLFEAPRRGEDFRRICISVFLAYEEADRYLRRLISEGEALDIFRNVDGENRPGFLYDFALTLREELTSSFSVAPGNGYEEMKQFWIDLRNMYFASLGVFLQGREETALLLTYMETPYFDSIVRIFGALRDKYDEVMRLRNELESAVKFSFCILGSSKDTEASALLANSILTGRAIRPGENFYLFFASLAGAFLICFFIKTLTPVFSLALGVIFSLFIGLGFSISFIISGVWLDPLIPAVACAAGVLLSTTWAAIAKRRFNKRISQAYGPHVSRACLKSVIRAGQPLPSRTIKANATMIAIRCSDPIETGDLYAKSVLEFHKKVFSLLKKTGGTIISTEGNLVIVSFGSPLERMFLNDNEKSLPYENSVSPAQRAVDFVSGITKNPEYASWEFGLDTGNCAFAWTNISGYFALGASVQRAKAFARMTDRYKVRVMISEAVLEAVPDLPAKKMGFLKEKDSSKGEPFFSMALDG